MDKSISIVFIIFIATLVATTAMIINNSSANAIPTGTCTLCAKDFALGQEAEIWSYTL
jgi:hypothetical protein